MTLRKDITATVLTALAVAAFAATHEGWGVPLIGASHRWATGAILVLGMLACGEGEKASRRATALFAVLGTIGFALAVLAFWTGSLTPLSLLVADVVVLWATATARHVRRLPRHTVAT